MHAHMLLEVRILIDHEQTQIRITHATNTYSACMAMMTTDFHSNQVVCF